MDYKYELHCHTNLVSGCGAATVRETLEYYKSLGYDGVFITDHFVDGNIRQEARSKSYAEQIEFFFSSYEEGLKIGEEIGIKVFSGLESSFEGMDALVYGLDKQWFLRHVEWQGMPRHDQLDYFRKNGAFVVQAHPFRKAWYISRIQLYPYNVDAFEVNNACNTDEENRLAEVVADSYGLIKLSGSDNHGASNQRHLAGVSFTRPIQSVQDFIKAVKNGEHKNFVLDV